MTEEEKKKRNIENGKRVGKEARRVIKETLAAAGEAGEAGEFIIFATHGGSDTTDAMCNAKGATMLDAVLHLFESLPTTAKMLAGVKVIESLRGQLGGAGAGTTEVLDKNKLH